MKRIAIYALLDSRRKVRYVGKSSEIGKRIYAHRRTKSWVDSWTILEWVTPETWEKRERYWIARYRKIGLFNKSTGGSGGSEFTMSLEGRRKISESNRRRQHPHGWHHTQEAKQAISKAHLGHHRGGWKFPKSGCEKISRALKGRVFTTEWRMKLSIAALERCARERGERI